MRLKSNSSGMVWAGKAMGLKMDDKNRVSSKDERKEVMAQ